MWVWLSSHCCEIFPVLPPRITYQQVVSESLVCGLGEYSLTLYRKSSWWWFQASMSRISVWKVVSEGSWVIYSGLSVLSLEGECMNVVEEWLSLEGEIVRYSSVSLSPTLGRNEKVERYIRKKTHKPNALRFWVEGGVIPLYVVWLISHSCLLPKVSPSDYSQQDLLKRAACRSDKTYRVNFFAKVAWARFFCLSKTI